eukprot:scaffold287105_cov24-Tisochrysis_lutea.AAC.3
MSAGEKREETRLDQASLACHLAGREPRLCLSPPVRRRKASQSRVHPHAAAGEVECVPKARHPS